MDSFLAKTPQQLGAILKGFRQKQNLTQAALAARLGLPQKAISLAETRPGQLPLTRLLAILGALGVELHLSGSPTGRAKVDW